jgi:hypothetical protein
MTRLQEETAKVEEHLLANRFDKATSFTDAIVRCLTLSKANAFENILDPLQKLLRLSPPVASTFARPDLFTRLRQKLHHNKAAVRLNLLRILSSICDSSEQQGGLLATYGLLDAIRELENDPAILVRDMAGKLVQSSEAFSLSKRRPTNRRQSTSTTPPIAFPGSSTPSTPSSNRTGQPRGYLEGRETPRHPRNSLSVSSLAMRPGSRDGNNPALGSSANSSAAALARPRSARPLSNRMSHVDVLREEDNKTPSSLGRRPSVIPRRRRPTLADSEWT